MALPPWNTCLSRTILWTGWFSTRATVLNWERRINSSVPESRAGSSTDGRAGPGAEGGKGVVSLALWFPATWPSGLPLLFLLRTEQTYFPSRSSPLTLLCLHMWCSPHLRFDSSLQPFIHFSSLSSEKPFLTCTHRVHELLFCNPSKSYVILSV